MEFAEAMEKIGAEYMAPKLDALRAHWDRLTQIQQEILYANVMRVAGVSANLQELWMWPEIRWCDDDDNQHTVAAVLAAEAMSAWLHGREYRPRLTKDA